MIDEPVHHPKITVESPKGPVKPEFESKLSSEMDPNLPHMLGAQMPPKRNKKRTNSKKKAKSTDHQVETSSSHSSQANSQQSYYLRNELCKFFMANNC